MAPLIACIITALVATATPDKLSPYRGQPVVAINIDAPITENPEELKKLISIEPGFLLGTTDLHTSIKRLYSLGRFSNVIVHAKRLAGSVELTFELKPILHLGDLEIEGISSDEEIRLRLALGLSNHLEIDSRTEAQIAQKARDFLHQTGYQSSTVNLQRTWTDATAHSDLLMEIELGEPTILSEIRFIGEPRLSSNHLRAMLTLRPGDALDQLKLAEELKNLEEAYLKKDFRTCQFKKPTIEMTNDGAVITVEINAGPRISLEFTGNKLLGDDSLLRLWPDNYGRLRQGDLGIFKRRIMGKYRRFGFFHIQVIPEGFIDRKSGVTRYLFKIIEGKPVKIQSLEFQGSKAFTDQELKQHIHSVIQSALGTDGIIQPLRSEDKDIVERGGALKRKPGTSPQMPRTHLIAQHQRWIPELFNEAFREIQAAYQDRGYLDAQIGPAKSTLVESRATIVVPVVEGEQTFVNTISFSNNINIPSAELLDVVYTSTQMAPGAPLSSSAIENARISLLRMYRDQGYIYCRIFTEIRKNPKTALYNVRFRFEESVQVRIGEVLVRGNRYTRENFIRQRISLDTGDVYRLDTALKDQREIANLGVFSSVQLRLLDEDNPAEQKDLVAEVKEQNRHRLQIGGGLSTEDGPRLRFSYSHLNLFGVGAVMTASIKLNRQIFFDLYGDLGQNIKDRYDSYDATEQLTKAIERELRLSFRSPRFTQWPWAPVLRVDFVNERDNRIAYFLETFAAIFGIEIHPTPWLKIALEPQASITNLECLTGIDCDTTDFESGNYYEQGVREGLKIGPLITADFRNNPLNPTKGWIAYFDARYATGRSRTPDTESSVDWWSYAFTKIEGRITGYLPFGQHVLALSGSGGHIQVHDSLDPNPSHFNKTPLDERFFLGGRNSLRGYLEDSIYPENCTDSCIGGQVFALFKSELRLKLSESISLDLFFETGNLWSQSLDTENFALRIGTGLGLSYSTPVGPLTLSIGFNPNPRENAPYSERLMEWHLAVGQF